jgi:hypothetical protein
MPLHQNRDGVGELSLCRRQLVAGQSKIRDNEFHDRRNQVGACAPSRCMKDEEVLLCYRVLVYSVNPAGGIKQLLRRGSLPGMSRDATNVHLNVDQNAIASAPTSRVHLCS